MDSRNKWISTRVQLGWMLLAAGVLVAVVGLVIRAQYAYLPYNFRIITGLGILLAAFGLSNLVRYSAALRDESTARRLAVEEKDERTLMIRARAGSRAFWVSTALAYIGLLWSSFTPNGALPELIGDTLWFFLAAVVIIPMGVYLTSIAIDQHKI